MFKPLRDIVVISRVKAPETGIVLPEGTELPRLQYGEVIATGPGIYEQGTVVRVMPVRPGNKIVYELGVARLIRFEGTEVLYLHASDILGVLDG